MQAWLESMAPGYGPALMWTVVALIGLLILLVVIRIVRGLTFGTFVAGGRTRKARLAVMDATAVDSHRRLVLVRRDDVEHLILIGGPSDVVVEQNIRLVPPARRPSPDEVPAETPRPPQQTEPAAPRAPAARPAPAAPPQRQPAAVPPPVQAFETERAHSQPAAPSVTVASPAPASAQPAPQREPRFSSLTAAPQPAPTAPHAGGVQTLRPVAAVPDPMPEIDDRSDAALLEELEVKLEREHRPAHTPEPPSAEDRSLDEEMSRLLSDLSGAKR